MKGQRRPMRTIYLSERQNTEAGALRAIIEWKERGTGRS